MTSVTEHDSRPPYPKPPLKRFAAWGLILGRLLPDAIDLGHVRIRKESSQRIAELTRSRQQLLHPSFEGGQVHFFSGVPADLLVRSHHSIWAWVDARDDEEALAAMSRKYLPPAVALLSAVNGEPVLIEILRISEEDERGYMADPRSPFSPSGMIGRREPATLEPEGVRFVEGSERLVRADECAASAARELSSAVHLFPKSGGAAANLRGVLLHYFFVLELIARKVSYGPEEKGEIVQLQEPLVNRGLARLQRTNAVDRKVRQIHALSLELKRLETSFLSDQVRRAGETLGVTPETVKDALRLTKFRNSRLGHASTKEVPAEELHTWLGLAEQVAIAYFRKYVDSLF